MSIETCKTEIRGNSVYFTPPSGRSFYGPVHELDLFPCVECNGEGHHDSCFDCGNRGYNDREGWLLQIS